MIEKLMEALDPGVDAALIVYEPNRFYLTGFHSTAGTVLATRRGAWFLTDFRYLESARQTVRGCEVVAEKDLPSQLGELLRSTGARNVAVETRTLPVARFQALSRALPVPVLDDTRLSDALAALRAVKGEEEIRSLRAAQCLTDRGFSYILGHIHPGVTEQDLIINLGSFLERLGSECRSLDFIAVSGPRTSLPHGKAGTRVIERGDFVTLDFGCVVNGYTSDMTRTIAVGEASSRMADIYAIVLEAQRRGLAAMRPGAVCRDVDAAARDYIAARGYGEQFGHGLGHSVGLEVHEDPRFSQTCTERLQPGNVLTVEPGIYLPGEFGVRIEDMALVTPSGCEDLTMSPKELIVV